MEDRRADGRPAAHDQQGRVLRLRPLRLLVISADRRFRDVSAMLSAQRGCAVFTSADALAAGELIARERIDVVVAEGANALRAVAHAAGTAGAPPPGVVAVADRAARGSRGAGVMAKWGPFEELFAAIERAELRRGPRWGGERAAATESLAAPAPGRG